MTDPQRRALTYLASVDWAAPSQIGAAIGGTRSNKAQGLGRIGGMIAARLIKAGLAQNRSHARSGFPAYGITAAGRQALRELEPRSND